MSPASQPFPRPISHFFSPSWVLEEAGYLFLSNSPPGTHIRLYHLLRSVPPLLQILSSTPTKASLNDGLLNSHLSRYCSVDTPRLCSHRYVLSVSGHFLEPSHPRLFLQLSGTRACSASTLRRKRSHTIIALKLLSKITPSSSGGS